MKICFQNTTKHKKHSSKYTYRWVSCQTRHMKNRRRKKINFQSRQIQKTKRKRSTSPENFFTRSAKKTNARPAKNSKFNHHFRICKSGFDFTFTTNIILQVRKEWLIREADLYTACFSQRLLLTAFDAVRCEHPNNFQARTRWSLETQSIVAWYNFQQQRNCCLIPLRNVCKTICKEAMWVRKRQTELVSRCIENHTNNTWPTNN